MKMPINYESKEFAKKRATELQAEGHTVKEITKILKVEGYTSSRGTPWALGSVGFLLTNRRTQAVTVAPRKSEDETLLTAVHTIINLPESKAKVAAAVINSYLNKTT